MIMNSVDTKPNSRRPLELFVLVTSTLFTDDLISGGKSQATQDVAWVSVVLDDFRNIEVSVRSATHGLHILNSLLGSTDVLPGGTKSLETHI